MTLANASTALIASSRQSPRGGGGPITGSLAIRLAALLSPCDMCVLPTAGVTGLCTSDASTTDEQCREALYDSNVIMGYGELLRCVGRDVFLLKLFWCVFVTLRPWAKARTFTEPSGTFFHVFTECFVRISFVARHGV